MFQFVQQTWTVWSYLIFGGLTTLINLLVFYSFYTWNHWMGYQVATFWAWFLSVIFAYVTNKIFVFDSHQTSQAGVWRELGSFFFFRILSYFLDVIIVTIGIGWLHGNSLIVKLIDNVVVVITNYIFSKVFIFKQK
ncbi:GtrA family protein [Bombilactobacillus apium]|uniref:GtrA family protein n=1 Tax=Bombilactobacillus apium TaxID=2675299 RepID=UPI003898EBB0